MTMMLTHSPFVRTPDSPDYNGKTCKTDPQTEGADGVNPHFAGMVAYMDKLIGKLLSRLDELGLRKNTLVLFVGANDTGRGLVSKMDNRTIIGGKGQTTAAGMHVPLLASWPAKMRGGRACSDLVDSTDFLPTICEATGVAVPASLKIDGRSFCAQLRGEKGRPREWIYCWYSREGVLTQARECAFNARFRPYRSGEFHDLTHDPEEKQPLTVATLAGDAAKTAKLLQFALDQYRDARPAVLKNLTVPKRNNADSQ